MFFRSLMIGTKRWCIEWRRRVCWTGEQGMRYWSCSCILVAVTCVGCSRSDESAETPTSQSSIPTSQSNTPTSRAKTPASRKVDPFYAESFLLFRAEDRTDGVPSRPATGSLLPTDPNIVRFVAYLAEKGLKLKHQTSGYWWVVDPMIDKFSIQVSIRTFRADATPNEMRLGLSHFALPYGLNTTARLAMSHPGLRGMTPDEYKGKPADFFEKLMAREDYKSVEARLKQLFLDFRP